MKSKDLHHFIFSAAFDFFTINLLLLFNSGEHGKQTTVHLIEDTCTSNSSYMSFSNSSFHYALILSNLYYKDVSPASAIGNHQSAAEHLSARHLLPVRTKEINNCPKPKNILKEHKTTSS